MEVHKIDYPLLENCLSQAQSKEHVAELFLNCCRLSNEISQFRLDCSHSSIQDICTNFSLASNQDAINLIWTINSFICKCLSEGAENCANGIPDSFNSKLKKLIFKIYLAYESDFKAYYTETFTSLPKLIDLDYRIDLKQFNRKNELVQPGDGESTRQAVLKLDLSLEQTEGKQHMKNTKLEISKDQLNEILNSFEKINQQLTDFTG
ncbi:unnamed protein product [Moneuplotes crassus]|uniref:COMM domain-containing protein n=1 Tax=Euplotes crassus TaxID=5936 RepID=A0AAD1XVK0_EUPCR|nr:unnamed protein product [Moneuplotes crassus]